MRWLSYDGSVGPVGTNARPVQCCEKNADEIAAMHNDTCDAYEARIAELEAKIASIDPVEFAAAVNDLNRAEARAEYAERLESELRECEADLARVKAESLRVVPVGEPCEIRKIAICQCFTHLANVYRLYSFSPEEFGAWQISDHSEHLFSPWTFIQPVRLARWEGSE